MLGKDHVIQNVFDKIEVMKIVVGMCNANVILATMKWSIPSMKLLKKVAFQAKPPCIVHHRRRTPPLGAVMFRSLYPRPHAGSLFGGSAWSAGCASAIWLLKCFGRSNVQTEHLDFFSGTSRI